MPLLTRGPALILGTTSLVAASLVATSFGAGVQPDTAQAALPHSQRDAAAKNFDVNRGRVNDVPLVFTFQSALSNFDTFATATAPVGTTFAAPPTNALYTYQGDPYVASNWSPLGDGGRFVGVDGCTVFDSNHQMSCHVYSKNGGSLTPESVAFMTRINVPSDYTTDAVGFGGTFTDSRFPRLESEIQAVLDAPTAVPTFPTAVTGRLQLSGVAEKNATVVVSGTGQPDVRVTASATDGSWSTPVTALGSGSQSYSVTQVIGGRTSPARTVPVDFGAAVSIDTPDQDPAQPGSVNLGGAAQQGALVSVTDNGSRTATPTVAGGRWSLTLSAQPAGAHHYVVTQVSQGNLTTTASTDATVAPSDKPFTIAAPGENETIVSANGRVDFSGTGTVGEPIHLETAGGTILGDTRVGFDGTWAKSTWRPLAANYTVKVTQGTGSTAETKTVHYTLKLSDAVSKPFTLLSPKENDTITSPAGAVTFTGEGTAGAKITITRGNNVPLGSGEVLKDGTFSIPTWAPISARYTVTLKENGAKPIVVHYNLNRQ